MQTETEGAKKISVDPVAYKVLEEMAADKDMTVDQYFEHLVKTWTTFDKPEQNDPSIEVPLTPEQYTKLRAWIDAGDFLETVSGPGEAKASIINSLQLWRKNHPGWKEEFGGEMVSLRISVFSPFVDFINQYREFLGIPDSLEDFCRKAIYDKVQAVHGDISRFVDDKKHLADPTAWYNRFPCQVHKDEEENEENDC